MTLLFLSYWGVNDPLTVATVYPNLAILNTFSHINKILFVTIERQNSNSKYIGGLNKVQHIPLFSKNYKINVVNKINDFLIFQKQIKKIISVHNTDKIIARGAPAGSLAYLVTKKSNIPFYVESFEPHSQYMLESGEWCKLDLRYIFERYWEKKQIQFAAKLLPVTENYKKRLVNIGVLSKNIHVVPCCVPINQFSYSESHRKKIRSRLNINNETITGIYVGKFGGLYYDHESFLLFKKTFIHFDEKFRLIILSPNHATIINKQLVNAGINPAMVFIGYVHHSEVSHYLSAADFAFSLIRPTSAMQYSSPVKNGEYWANGLPILSTENIGDDHHIIETENSGAVFCLKKDNLSTSLDKIKKIISMSDSRERIRQIACKYRGQKIGENIYKKII